MSTPRVSVIIPAYNGADFLGEAIQSVLDQTYPDFEIVVVDDASSDQTAEVVRKFESPRLKYLVHGKNLGANASRNTGLHASSGQIIAFLDQDDIFHPHKLQAHVEFRKRHPHVGFTYNARFVFSHSKRIRELWRPPDVINLQELVLGFPIAPSEAVLSRDWALRMNLVGCPLPYGGETVLFGKLLLQGCKFGYVDRALNYRRYHSGRVLKNLARACSSELSAQVQIFDDPRCPDEVLALRNLAHSNTHLIWAYHAFAQRETALGQELTRKSIGLNPGLLDGSPSGLMEFLLENSINDDSVDHVDLLQRIVTQLPSEVAKVAEYYDYAVAQGYLLKAARAVMWGRESEACRYFDRAASLGAEAGETYLRRLAHQLLCYESEFGGQAVSNIFGALLPGVARIAGRRGIRCLRGCYSANLALRRYRSNQYTKVPVAVIRAVANNPSFLRNRGMMSIFLKSIIGVCFPESSPNGSQLAN